MRDKWWEDARCRGNLRHDLFFTDTKSLKNIAEAKKFCYQCTVRIDCLEAGLKEQGIWGGTTEEERPNVWGWYQLGLLSQPVRVGPPLREPLPQGDQRPTKVHRNFQLLVKKVDKVSSGVLNVRSGFTLNVGQARPSVPNRLDRRLLEFKLQLV